MKEAAASLNDISSLCKQQQQNPEPIQVLNLTMFSAKMALYRIGRTISIVH